jgi:hypothetical protein
MNISPSSFVTIDEILADVLKSVDDSGFKVHSRGYYISQAQQAIEELAFDTFFSEHNMAFDMPENLRLEMPKNAFNLKQLYAFSGDDCTIENSAVIYYKRNFINAKSGNGYVARDKYDNRKDPFQKQRTFRDDSFLNSRRNIEVRSQSSELLYYGIQNGLIMLSTSCKKYPKVMMVYNGTGTEIGEAPIIPLFMRQAVKDYVTVKALETRMAMETEAFNKWASLYRIHSENLNKPYEGSWAKAEKRVKNLDSKQRADIKEYMARLDY